MSDLDTLRTAYNRLRDQVEHQEGGIGDTEIRALVVERDALRAMLERVVLVYGRDDNHVIADAYALLSTLRPR